jgi:tetratricopeptide (TPR) repeat protein
MASIIEGYEYDIFISYRQKDNKGDRWVSRFVEALKTELEGTFKEDVSVYFDENPDDRLQETHDVDKSLEGKLKCLIFIPILSQTYSDPQSYAWQYEFLPFIKLAGGDRFGKDIRLRSGNFGSRVLPIRIHDIEEEDVKLFEKETGLKLRALDFVFRTATGVSRPLLQNEDHPNENLNKTFYRDQINKVAHAIKDIITGMKTETVPNAEDKLKFKGQYNETEKAERIPETMKTAVLPKKNLIPILSLAAILVVTGIFLYPKILKKDRFDYYRSKGEISVAVLPFQNLTNDDRRNFWQEMIQDNLVTSLSNSEALKVRQTQSVIGLLQNIDISNYASITPSIARNISKRLDANVFIHGSINQIGTTIRLTAKLVDSKTEEVLKSFQLDGNIDNILHMADSLSGMVSNFLILTRLKKESSPFIKTSVSTSSPEAYKCYIYGLNTFYKRDYVTAINWLSQAVGIDSGFISARVMLSMAYSSQGMTSQARINALRAYRMRDRLPMQQKLIADWLHAVYYETYHEENKYLTQYLEYDAQAPPIYYMLGLNYNGLYQYDKAIPAFKKALEIYDRWDMKPPWVFNYTNFGLAYHKTGQYQKEKRLYKKAEQNFPDEPLLLYRQSILELSQGRLKKAGEYIDRYVSLHKENKSSEATIANNLAGIYEQAEIPNKAEEHYRQALSLDPLDPIRLYSLAYFLIDSEQDVNEGLELIEKASTSGLDGFYYADCKGWGLYKQGKYNEALELLQRSWDGRRIYDHDVFLHLDAAKRAVVGQK